MISNAVDSPFEQAKMAKEQEQRQKIQLKQMFDVYKRFESNYKEVISRKKLLTMDYTQEQTLGANRKIMETEKKATPASVTFH